MRHVARPKKRPESRGLWPRVSPRDQWRRKARSPGPSSIPVTGAALASLGNSLQTKMHNLDEAWPQDVWGHLMNRPALGGAPVKLAMNTVISNKQIEAGAAIAGDISNQGQSTTAASIYAQSAAVAGTTDNGGTGSTATQITSSALIRTGAPAPASGQVPVPGALGLLVAGLMVLGAKSRIKNQEGLN